MDQRPAHQPLRPTVDTNPRTEDGTTARSPGRRSILKGFGALGAGAALAGCTSGPTSAKKATKPSGSYAPPGAADRFVATSSEQRHTVTVNQAFHSLLYLTLYIAHDVGFFDEEGIDLKVATGGGGSQAWSAVLGGSAQYSIQDPIFPSISAAKGQTGGVVSGTIANGMACLAVAKDPSITKVSNAKDFMTKAVKGRTVVTQPEPDSAWAQMKYLGELYGVRLGRDFKNIQVPLGTEPALVIQGKADIAVGWPPSVDLSLGQGLHEVFDFSRFWGPFALSGLTTKRSYVEKNPQAHQGVLNALEKASQYAYAYPDEAVKIAQREFPDSDPELVESSTRRMLSRLMLPQHVAVEDLAFKQDQFVNQYAGSVKTMQSSESGVGNAAALQAYRSFGYAPLALWKSPRRITARVAR